MAKYSNEVIYNIKTTLDSSGITKLQNQLTSLQTKMQSTLMGKGTSAYSSDALKKDIQNIEKLKGIISNSFNAKTGMFDLNAFNKNFTTSGLKAQELAKSFSMMGAEGKTALASLTTQLTTFQRGMRNVSSLTEKFQTTIGNTARWGLVSMGFQSIVSSVSEAVHYVKELDESLTQITMVSGESRDAMKEFASYANQAAKTLGSTTTNFTNATKLFIQEGFSLEESKKQATQATILANVSEQDTATTADQITAYRNAFLKDSSGSALQGQEAIDKMSNSLDKFANIANNTAANVQELMVASQRAASTASAVGADEDTFLASVATIQAVTRESAENIGNGLKSIYTRFADIKMGKSTEDDVNLGQYGNALKSAGVDILDNKGQFKGMTQIFKELQEQWGNLSETQKVAVGEKVAGRFQYNRFAALMNNPEYFEKAYSASINAEGSMDRMQEAYMQGMNAKMKQFTTNFETLFTNIYNSGAAEGIVDLLNGFSQAMSKIFETFDSGLPIVTALAAILPKLFSSMISQGIGNMSLNRAQSKQEQINMNALKNGVNIPILRGMGADSKFLDIQQKIGSYLPNLSRDSQKNHLMVTKSYEDLISKKAQSQDRLSKTMSKAGLTGKDADMKTYIQQQKAYSDAADVARQKATALRTELNSMSDVERKNATHTKNAVEAAEKHAQAMRRKASEMQRDIDIVQKETAAQEQYTMAIKETTAQLERMSAAYKTESTINRVMNGVSGFASYAMGIQMMASSFAELSELMDSSDAKMTDWLGTVAMLGMSFAMMAGPMKSAYGAMQNWTKSLAASKAASVAQIETEMNLIRADQQKVASMSTVITSEIGKQRVEEASARVNARYEAAERRKAQALRESALAANSAKLAMAGLMAVTLAIGAGAVIYDNYQEKLKENAELEQKQSEIATEKYEKVKKSSESYKVLYEEYQKTGKVSDELKSSSKELADAIGTSGAKAAAAAADYNALAKAAENASSSEKKAVEEALRHQLKGSIKTSLDGGIGNGSIYSDAMAATSVVDDTIFDKNGKGLQKYKPVIKSSMTTGELYAALEKSKADTKVRVSELNDKENKGVITEEEKKELTNLNSLITGVDKVLNQDDMAQWHETAGKLADLVSQDVQNDIKGLSDGAAVANKYLENKDIKDYLSSMPDYIDQLDWMIEHTSDGVAQNALKYNRAQEQLKRNVVSAGGSESDSKEILDKLNSKLTNEELIKFAGQLDVDLTKSNIDKQIDSFLTDEFTISIDAKLDPSTLKEPVEEKAKISGIINDYEKNNNVYSEDEAAKLLVEHPEYVDYLVKVGDQYKLNKRALVELNEKTREQTQAMEELRGTDIDLTELTNNLTKLQNASGDEVYSDEKYQGAVQTLKELNYQLEQGKITNEQFLNNLSNSFDLVVNEASKAGKTLEDFVNNSEAWRNFVSVLTDELFRGLEQANRQLKSGEKTIGDYARTIKKSSEQAMKLAQATGKLTDAQVKHIKKAETEFDALKDLTGEQKKAAKQIYDLSKSMDSLDKAANFSDYITKNFDKMTEVFSDSFDVLESARNRAGGVKKEYQNLFSGIADSAVAFYKANDQAAEQMAAQLSATYGQSQDTYLKMLQGYSGSSSELLSAMMSDANLCGDVVEGTAAQTQNSVSQMASGISAIITGVTSMIGNINAEVKGEPKPDEGVNETWSFDNPKTGEKQTGTLHVPGFTMHISGSSNGGGGSSSGKGTTTYNESTGKYETTTYDSDNDTVGGISTTRDATAQEIVDYGSKQLAEGFLGGKNKPSMSQYAPAGQGGAYNPSGSGGPGGGGGGGGKDKKIKDSTKKAIDIYQEVNNTLEKIESKYDKIDDITDRLYGKNKIDNIRKAAAAEKEELDTLSKKLSIQEKEVNRLRNEKTDENGDPSIGKFLKSSDFDDNGTIKQTAYEAKYNKLYKKVKSFEGKDEEQYGDAYKKAQDELNDFVNAVNKYNDELKSEDDTISKMRDGFNNLMDKSAALADTFQELMDTVRKTYETADDIQDVFDWWENNRDKKTSTGETRLAPGNQIWTSDLKSSLRKGNTFFNQEYENEFTKKRIKGAANNSFETMNYWSNQKDLHDTVMKPYFDKYYELTEKGSNASKEEILAAEKALRDKANDVGYGIDKESGLPYDEAYVNEKLKEAYDNAAGDIQTIKDNIDKTTNDIDKTVETIHDEYKYRFNQYDNIIDGLEDLTDITELLYGNQSYGNQNRILSQEISALRGKAQEINQAIDLQKDTLEKTERRFGKDSEQYHKEQEVMQELQKEQNATLNQTLEKVNGIYQNTVNKNVNDYIAGLFGGSYDSNGILSGMDLDWYNDKWDLITRNAEQYKDEVERAYEIQKLQSKYMDMLDGENNLLNQQKITEQMNEQLQYLREKKNLSEYDVAYANAQLDILQKTIALEDARANKSQMKLKRDAQGNYSYRYTANEDNVKGAENDLLDAQYNAYDLTKNADIETQEGIAGAIGTFKDNLINTLTNMTLSAEEKQNRLRFLIDNFKEYVGNASGDLKDIANNLLTDVSEVAQLVTEENSKGLVAIFDDTGQVTFDTLQNIDERFDNFIIDRLDNFAEFSDGLEALNEDSIHAIKEWAAETKNALADAGKSYEDFTEEAVKPAQQATQDMLDTTSEFLKVLDAQLKSLEGADANLLQWNNEMNALRTQHAEELKKVQDQLTESNKKNTDLQTKIDDLTKPKDQSPKTSGENSGNKYGGTKYDKKTLIEGIAGAIWSYGDAGWWGTSESEEKKLLEKKFGKSGSELWQPIYNTLSSYYGSKSPEHWTKSGDMSYYKKFYASKFDTGGYTGNWSGQGLDGKGGKAAILHQKELVLNAADTENILSAVELIRDMTFQMKNAAFGTVLDMISEFKNVNRDLSQNNIEQRVQIEANFPNASDANEIRQALISLADDAYQYTSKNY